MMRPLRRGGPAKHVSARSHPQPARPLSSVHRLRNRLGFVSCSRRHPATGRRLGGAGAAGVDRRRRALSPLPADLPGACPFAPRSRRSLLPPPPPLPPPPALPLL